MIYSVIVDVSNSNVDKIFDYKSDIDYQLGQRVEVDFAHRVTEGFIVDKKSHTDYPLDKVKTIICAKDEFSAISLEMLQLAKYMQSKYHLRFIDVLRLFVPAEMRGNRVSTLTKKQASINHDSNLSVEQMLNSLKSNAQKQRQLLTFLSQNGATLCEQLNAQFGNAAVNALHTKGYLRFDMVTVQRTPYKTLAKSHRQPHVLSAAQQQVVDQVMANPTASFLLHGVTGSGKTEVYMNIIQQTVDAGKTCIMLVPEISLTPNVLAQFRNRFGDVVAMIHSGLSAGERYDEWLRLKNGDAKIVVGARSAIFAPLTNVGAIIIDEEHDASYVSDFNPRYNTVDVAQFRQQYNGSLLLLGSATPSLESFYKAQQGEYKLLRLPERINQRPLPTVEIADMAHEVRQGNRTIFSQTLKDRLSQTIKSGNQAILFLNRRGYSSFMMCTKCGYVARCTDCDVALTYHREDNELKCHYCKKRFHVLTHCPECHSQSFRQGKIGTQQIVQLLEQLYPGVKVLRMDADTTQNKEGHVKILSAFAAQEAQILVGTQMIAKGHDFPHVTLVGILDGDQSLYYSDYLSAERTFQLLTQVAGRSGRDKDAGRVVLQTYTPKHYCLQLASRQDYLGFYRKEIALRKASKFPPFAAIVRVLYQGENEQSCIDLVTKHFAEIDKIKQTNPDAFFYLDKMRCPLKRAERKFRFQIMIKLEMDTAEDIIQQIYATTDAYKHKDVQVFVELNPQNLS